MKYIVLKVPCTEESIFIGKIGKLLSKPTNFEYGEIEVEYDGDKIIVYVDYNQYAPYSPLLKELL